MAERCLICGKDTEAGEEYHSRCRGNFFGTPSTPVLQWSLGELKEQAAKSVLSRITVAGVQKKLSLGVEKKGKDARFVIVGLWGGFILKPPADEYPFLPENEDTVMRLASLAGIPVVPHAMIRLASGELAYSSKRTDRDAKGGKFAMEDFCQLSERLTEDKYKGSIERIGKLLRGYSVYPGLDAVDLFERAVFNFIVGNGDMHLKNYSLIETPDGMRLSPAYDLVSTALAIPDDPEESALTVNGKKSKLGRVDFEALGERLEIRKPAVGNIFHRMQDAVEPMMVSVKNGRLPLPMQMMLCDLIRKRAAALASISTLK
jgi:serine/threonine-protein kinase HipA